MVVGQQAPQVEELRVDPALELPLVECHLHLHVTSVGKQLVGGLDMADALSADGAFQVDVAQACQLVGHADALALDVL